MSRRWFLVLAIACLVPSAAARPSYSKWLVTAADFQQKAAAPQEKWERGTTPFIGTQWYQYTYRRSPIFLLSHLEVDSEEDTARDGYAGGQLFGGFSRTPKGWVKHDLSKQIKAGDESHCNYYSGAGGEMWLFAFRKGKVCGILVFTGIHIERPAFQKLVTQWTQRARLADPSFHPAKAKR